MPKYTYIDLKTDYRKEVNHPVDFAGTIMNSTAGNPMVRMPSKVAGINWGGLSPSQGEFSDVTKQLIGGADQRREDYERLHANE